MNAQAETSDEHDGQFCWQQVLRVRPLVRLSHPYAPRESSSKVLALYALCCAVEEALCQASDEIVSRTKLSWWQQQLLSSESSTSNHPITRQLHKTGLISEHSHGWLQFLLETTLDRIDVTAPKDELELKSLCESVGLSQMRLELAIQDQHPGQEELLVAACAVNGLVQLLRESSRSQTPAYGWLPLNLLARYELTRHDLQSGVSTEKAQKLLKQLHDTGTSWVASGDSDSSQPEVLTSLKGNRCKRLRHWLIQTALNIRLLGQLQATPFDQHASAFSKAGPADAWFAWRCARNLPVGKGSS